MDLIDRAELKKNYPISSNGFGLVVNDDLHKILDSAQKVDAVPIVVEAEEEQNPCDDAISRQAVINSFKNWLNDNKDPRSFEEVVKEMPSAISGQKEGDS